MDTPEGIIDVPTDTDRQDPQALGDEGVMEVDVGSLEFVAGGCVGGGGIGNR